MASAESSRARHRSESRGLPDRRRPMKAVARKHGQCPGALHVGDAVRVFSRTAEIWVDGEVVSFVDDHCVRVEYEVGEHWFGKTLHVHSDHLDIPSTISLESRRLRTKEESLVLGVSVAFLLREFLNEVEDRFGPGADPNYYAINEVMLFGSSARGLGMTCPRDGLPGCSYVDSLDCRHTGPATVMLSWCWQYTARTVVTALERWCHRSGLDTCQTYVWQCALCNNQFRIQENMSQGVAQPLDAFREGLEARMRATGHVLALLSPYDHPIYIQRVWCMFELWIALKYGLKVDLVLPQADEKEFWTEFTGNSDSGGLRGLWKVFQQLRIQDAKATVESDRDNIFTLIDPHARTQADLEQSASIAALNHRVAQKLQTWFVDVVRSRVESQLDSGYAPARGVLRKTTDLLTQVADYERAEAILRRALGALERDTCDQEQIAEAQLCIADVCNWGYSGSRDTEALELYSKVKDFREATGIATSMTLLTQIVIISQRQGLHADVLQLFLQAETLCRSTGTKMGSGLLHFVGRSFRMEGLHSKAMEFFLRAEASFKTAGLEFCPSRAWLLVSMGALLDDQECHEEASKTLLQAKNMFEASASTGHPGYPELSKYIANRGRSTPLA